MYVFDQIVSTEVDMAGKFRVLVAATSGTERATFMLKFQSTPTQQQIQDASVQPIYLLNNPPTVETLESLREKLAQLVTLREDIRLILRNGSLTAVQKLTALNNLLGE